MLHNLTRITTGSDQAFYDVLRDFVGTHAGGYPTTDDFRAALERHVEGDWQWFFDQWVYGAGVPNYEWRARTAGSVADGYRVEVEVSQKNVPDGFRMDVPLRVELADGEEAEYLVTVDRPEQTLTVELERQPRKVIFNPDHSVLARTRKR